MFDEQRWQAVTSRDGGGDGGFVYGVTSTGIYCRPSCASRRPNRANVRFFDLPGAAEAAGFRACRRCRPEAAAEDSLAVRAARAIEAALGVEGEGQAPTLAELGASLGVSGGHLQRNFRAALGVSPRAYGDRLRRNGVHRQPVFGHDPYRLVVEGPDPFL